ncbi:hypothetical protein B0H15DRAFT_1026930 [Mycena belliarum]|uniref:Uncharacterized protein n=1 Tax=Mycena belliarum TaxID=1033014 RepID=A0AAD6TSW0_9AGAR|nr:hypothetical protein B0H15DRAFT_1026930 [Mycena belliae]
MVSGTPSLDFTTASIHHGTNPVVVLVPLRAVLHHKQRAQDIVALLTKPAQAKRRSRRAEAADHSVSTQPSRDSVELEHEPGSRDLHTVRFEVRAEGESPKEEEARREFEDSLGWSSRGARSISVNTVKIQGFTAETAISTKVPTRSQRGAPPSSRSSPSICANLSSCKLSTNGAQAAGTRALQAAVHGLRKDCEGDFRLPQRRMRI